MRKFWTILPASEVNSREIIHLVRDFQAERRIAEPDILSSSRLLAALCDQTRPTSVHFEVLLNESADLAGFVIWNEVFSVYRGGVIYSIDAMYVKQSPKNAGATQALYAHVARAAVEAGVAGVSWLAARNSPEEQAFIEALNVRPFDNLRFVYVTSGQLRRAHQRTAAGVLA